MRHFWAVAVVAAALAGKIGLGLMEEESMIVRRVSTGQKVVALTFDDGPNSRTTPAILKVLREKQVKATFFVLGENVKAYPEVVEQAAAAGHEIASHGYSHRHMTGLSDDECALELAQTEEQLGALQISPDLFRPPGGLYNAAVLAAAKKRGYRVILWSVDPVDWKRPGVDYVVRTVLDKAAAGGIILLHDGLYPLPTPQALGTIIDRLRSAGYTIVTVSELLKYQELSRSEQDGLNAGTALSGATGL